jgi:hypothetical protein
MTTITVKDFAKEKNILTVTIYKQIEICGIEPVGIIKGRTRPHALYNKDTLEMLILKRDVGRPKKNESEREKETFNTSKLW